MSALSPNNQGKIIVMSKSGIFWAGTYILLGVTTPVHSVCVGECGMVKWEIVYGCEGGIIKVLFCVCD